MRGFTYPTRLAAARANFEALRHYVRLRDDAWRENGGEYLTLSVRQALHILGVSREATDDVIALIGNGGFDYCLDPEWVCERTGETPPEFACIWGIDQLRSRLDCVSV